MIGQVLSALGFIGALIEVTPGNRNGLPGKLAARLEAALKERRE